MSERPPSVSEIEARAKRYLLAKLEGRWVAVATDLASEPEAVRARVEALCAAAERMGGFMAGPIVPPDEDEFLLAGTVLGERYELKEFLGAGAFAKVYRATDRRLAGREVAVKVFHTGVLTQALLEPEVRSMAKVTHGGIVRVTDVGDTGDGRPYLVRDYFDGETLRDRMGRGPMGEGEVASVIGQLCEALAEAHAHGLVHCDLKPENVLVNAAGRVALIDFGLAELFDGMQREVLRSSNRYAAPELLNGAKPTAAADLYSLGCIWAELQPGRWRRQTRQLMAAEPGRRASSARAVLAGLRWRERRPKLWWAVAAVGLAGLAGALLHRGMTAREPVIPHLAPVTAFAGSEGDPSLSPDGETIVFSWLQEGTKSEAVFRMPVAGGTPVQLSPPGEEAKEPVISPDGKRVAYFQHFPHTERLRLRAVPLEGGAVETLAEGWFSWVDWMPDGRRLLVSQAIDGDLSRQVLAMVDPAAGTVREVTPRDGKSRLRPAVSPDGKRVAYTQQVSRGPAKLVVGEFRGTELVDVGASPEYPDMRPPAWTPDGRHVLFAAGRANNRQVHAARWDDLRNPRLLPGFGQKLDGIAVAKRRAVAVVSQSQDDQNLWRVDLAGPGGPVTGSRLIAQTTWDDEEPSLSEATGRVLYISDQSGSEQVWEANYDGTNARRLTDYASGHSLVVFAVPGRKLALAGGRFGSAMGYHELALDGRELVREPVPFREGRLAGVGLDGRYAYAQKGTKVWRVGLADGKETAILEAKAYRVEEARDGSVWHALQTGNPVWRNGKQTGEIIERRAFAAGREGVYFVSRSRPTVLQYRRTADGVCRDLMRLTGEIGFGMTLRSDERMLVIAVMDRLGGDLLAVRDFELF